MKASSSPFIADSVAVYVIKSPFSSYFFKSVNSALYSFPAFNVTVLSVPSSVTTTPVITYSFDASLSPVTICFDTGSDVLSSCTVVTSNVFTNFPSSGSSCL